MAELPRPDDDHGSDYDDLPDLPTQWADLVIPDDARELSAESAALRHELQRAQRQQRWTRVLRTRRFQRYGISGPLVALCLLVTGIFGSLMFLLPSTPGAPAAQRLARPSRPAGVVGGLLPPATLQSSTGDTVQTMDVRPAAVLVLPVGCACNPVVDKLVAETSVDRVHVLIVSEGTATPQALPSNAPRERVLSVADPERLLASALVAADPSTATSSPALSPTGVFVHGDGTIASVLTHLQNRSNLTAEIDNIA